MSKRILLNAGRWKKKNDSETLSLSKRLVKRFSRKQVKAMVSKYEEYLTNLPALPLPHEVLTNGTTTATTTMAEVEVNDFSGFRHNVDMKFYVPDADDDDGYCHYASDEDLEDNPKDKPKDGNIWGNPIVDDSLLLSVPEEKEVPEEEVLEEVPEESLEVRSRRQQDLEHKEWCDKTGEVQEDQSWMEPVAPIDFNAMVPEHFIEDRQWCTCKLTPEGSFNTCGLCQIIQNMQRQLDILSHEVNNVVAVVNQITAHLRLTLKQ